MENPQKVNRMSEQNKAVLDAAAMGRLFIVGDYRGGVASEFSGDDKKTGRRRSY